MKLLCWLVACLAVLSLASCSSEPGEADSLSGVIDLQNRPTNPFQVPGAKATVLVFIRTDCPISNRYAPEIERLAGDYGRKGFAFWLVYPEKGTSAADIQRHLQEYHLNSKPLRDPKHVLVKKAGVGVTPEVAVFLPDGQQLYRGRIDDRYSDFGQQRPEPTQRDLESTLTALAAGKPVTRTSTRAIGCYIE